MKPSEVAVTGPEKWEFLIDGVAEGKNITFVLSCEHEVVKLSCTILGIEVKNREMEEWIVLCEAHATQITIGGESGLAVNSEIIRLITHGGHTGPVRIYYSLKSCTGNLIG